MTQLDFPNAPTEGQIYAPPGGPRYQWNSPVWDIISVPANASASDAFWATRAALVASVAGGMPISNGKVYAAGGLQYVGTGLGVIPDMPGLSPQEPAKPEHFGAVGDGVADDRLKLQAWLTYPGAERIATGKIYAISDVITSTEANRRIWIETLKVTATDKTALKVTGAGSKITARIDGNGKCAIGVLVETGGCEVYGCEIFNLYSTLASPDVVVGIRSRTLEGVNIHDNRIRDLDAAHDGDISGGLGSTRAIQVWGEGAAVRPSRVANNFMENINGEESDAISTLFHVSTLPFYPARLHIVDNVIKNSHRRSIKVQASEVIVRGNRVFSDIAVPVNPSSHISVIASNDVVVEGNHVDFRACGGVNNGIYIGSALSGQVSKNNTVRDNTVYANNLGFAVWIDEMQESRVTGNMISNGVKGIAMTSSTRIELDFNTFRDGVNGATSYDIDVGTSNSEIYVRGNIGLTGERLYMINSRAPDCVYDNNHSRRPTGGQVIGVFSTAVRSIYNGTSNKSAENTLAGDLTGQFPRVSQNVGTGDSGGGAGAVFSSYDIPTVSYPTQRFSRGDVAFENGPTLGGVHGWVCTVDGTPGTWWPMSSVGTLDLIVSAPSSALALASNSINTDEKRTGKLCHDATTNKVMRATGTATTSTWVSVDGATTITPV